MDQPVTNFIYDDFDNNGDYEAIAFCGEYYEEDGSYFGTLYFVSQEGVQVIREEDGYWNDGEVYDFGDSKVIAITEYFTTGGLTEPDVILVYLGTNEVLLYFLIHMQGFMLKIPGCARRK